MTIRFTQVWNGYQPDQIVSLSAAEEARLVSLGFASTDLDGPDGDGALARFSKDASGRVTGLVGPDGGRLAAVKARALPPQVETSAYAGAPTITDLATATSGIASGVRVTKDDPCFTYLSASLGAWASNSNYVAPSSLSNFMAVTFCTDAPAFELYLNRYNSRVMIEVDGRPALSSHISLDSNGSPNLVKVDFSGVRQARTIRVSGYNMPFGGLYIGPSDSVWLAKDSRPLISFVGDSYSQGTGANAQALTWAATCARLLDYQYWIDGIGSTGYTTAGVNSMANRTAARTNALVRRIAGINEQVTPDYQVWALGYNDFSAAQSAVETGFDEGYTASNKNPDVIIGPWTPLGSTAGLDNIRAWLQSRASAKNLPYIDIKNYVNSANKTVLTGGDNVHPVQAGHDYLGYRIAQDLIAAGF